MPDTIHSLTRTTTVANIVDKIREKIILQEYTTGSIVTELALADEYGTSRGSIRTALQILENEGMIATMANGRKRIVGITERTIYDLYYTRGILECESARLILAMEQVDFSAMAAAVGRIGSATNQPPEIMRRERNLAHQQFHRALVGMSKNRSLLLCWNTIEPLAFALTKFNSETLDTTTHEHDYVLSHTKILEMFLSKDQGIIEYLVYHTRDAAYKDTMNGLRKIGCTI